MVLEVSVVLNSSSFVFLDALMFQEKHVLLVFLLCIEQTNNS